MAESASSPFYAVATAYVVTEAEILTSLVLATISGAFVLLLFMAVRGVMGVYQKRMEIADLGARPRLLKLGTRSQIWNFLIPSITVYEEELLETAGLDAMVLLRSMVLGIQLFLPLSILGCAVLLPVNLSGRAVDTGAAQGQAFGNSLMYCSLANLPPGSDLYWLVFVFHLMFCGYTLWLLSVHVKAVRLLRLQYLMRVRPLRLAGDYGCLKLLGPSQLESLDQDARRRIVRVLHELVNPLAMYGWGVHSWERLHSSEHWRMGTQEVELGHWPAVKAPSGGKAADAGVGAGAGLTPDVVWLQEGADQRMHVEGGFEHHRSTWSEHDPLFTLTGSEDSTGLFPWWLDQHEQPPLLVDDKNVLLLGKSNVHRRQLIPAVSHQKQRLGFAQHRGPGESGVASFSGQRPPGIQGQPSFRIASAAAPSPVPTTSPQAGGQGLSAGAGVGVDQKAGLLLQSDVKANCFHYAVLIQATRDPAPERDGLSLMPFGGRCRRRPAGHTGAIGADEEAAQPGAKSMAKRGSHGHVRSGSSARLAAGQAAASWQGRQADELLQSLTELFPGTFKALVPVYDHQKVDDLLMQLDQAMNRVDQERERLELLAMHGKAAAVSSSPSKTGSKVAPAAGFPPTTWQFWFLRPDQGLEQGKTKAGVPTLTELLSECRRLEALVLEAREDALQHPPCHAFFALFSCQRDAHLLSSCSIGCKSWSWMCKYRTMLAPAPENVNWQTLWTSTQTRLWRGIALLLPLWITIWFPMGLVAGTLTNLDTAMCSNPDAKIYWPWYCQATGFWHRIGKALLTGLVPMTLNTFWDTYVMPLALYLICQARRKYVSLSAVDQAVTHNFFIYGVINNFLMVVLSGGTFSQIGSFLDGSTVTGSGRILYAIAQALAGACNYFFNALIWKTLFTNIFRFVWPHDGTVLFVFFRLAGFHRPKGPRDRMVIRTNPSYRGGRHYGAMFLVFIPGLMYAVINPAILPLCLGYFCTAWYTWKYCILYFYECSHESGGAMFDQVVNGIIVTVALSGAFTGITLIARHAWVAGSLLVVLVPVLAAKFHRLHEASSFSPDKHYPIEALLKAPTAVVNPLQYVPPSLRNGAVGWYPEQQKVWEKYGIPRYA